MAADALGAEPAFAEFARHQRTCLTRKQQLQHLVTMPHLKMLLLRVSYNADR